MQTTIAERRRTPRVKLSQPVRIQPVDSRYPSEICKTSNVSRGGLYFETWSERYFEGQELLVTRNYRSDDFANQEETGAVVRVEKFPNGLFGIAVHVRTTTYR
jgi:hypothetical protein